jgi:hypothetical protein
MSLVSAADYYNKFYTPENKSVLYSQSDFEVLVNHLSRLFSLRLCQVIQAPEMNASTTSIVYYYNYYCSSFQ